MRRRLVDLRRLRAVDRAVEMRGRHLVAEEVNILQVLPEKLVEEDVVLAAEVRPVPPEPVASFGGVDFAHRGSMAFRVERAGVDLPLKEGARFAQEVPGAVFLVLADPDVEVAPDPGTGVEGRNLAPGRMPPEMIFYGATVQDGV